MQETNNITPEYIIKATSEYNSKIDYAELMIYLLKKELEVSSN